LILLTPIRDVVSTVSDGTPTLAIIGTGDALYDTVKVEAESQRTNITWKVFDGLTHSLERREDWKQSLAVLPEIIGACEGFLRAARQGN